MNQLALIILLAAVVTARPQQQQQSVDTSLSQIGSAIKIATQQTAQSAASAATDTALRAVGAGNAVEHAVRQEAQTDKLQQLAAPVPTTTLNPLSLRQKRQIVTTTEKTPFAQPRQSTSDSLPSAGNAASVAQSEVHRSALDAGIAAGNAAINTASAAEISAEKVADVARKAALAVTRS